MTWLDLPRTTRYTEAAVCRVDRSWGFVRDDTKPARRIWPAWPLQHQNRLQPHSVAAFRRWVMWSTSVNVSVYVYIFKCPLSLNLGGFMSLEGLHWLITLFLQLCDLYRTMNLVSVSSKESLCKVQRASWLCFNYPGKIHSVCSCNDGIFAIDTKM